MILSSPKKNDFIVPNNSKSKNDSEIKIDSKRKQTSQIPQDSDPFIKRADYSKETYSKKLFEKAFSAVRIDQDGDCFFNSILLGLGLEHKAQNLRNVIADWIIENKDVCSKFGMTDQELVNRAESIRKREWGDEIEMHVFEIM